MATVLIIDDESYVREMMRLMIEPLGYEVVEAENGAIASKFIQNTTPDLIITDIVMPEKNGIDVIMEVKKSSNPIPIIAISGGGGITGRFDYLEIAKLVGAENILKKPFAMEELRSLVENILQEKE